FQAEDGIRDWSVTGVQTCALPICVERALSVITSPRHGKGILAAGMVRDIAVDDAGAVTFTFVLTREDPGSLARRARKAVEGVAGSEERRVGEEGGGQWGAER